MTKVFVEQPLALPGYAKKYFVKSSRLIIIKYVLFLWFDNGYSTDKLFVLNKVEQILSQNLIEHNKPRFFRHWRISPKLQLGGIQLFCTLAIRGIQSIWKNFKVLGNLIHGRARSSYYPPFDIVEFLAGTQTKWHDTW